MSKGKEYIVKTTWRNPSKKYIYSHMTCCTGRHNNKRQAKIHAFIAARFNNDFVGMSYYSSEVSIHREWIYHIKPFFKSLFKPELVKVEGRFILAGPWYKRGIKKSWFELTEEQKKLVGTKVE